MYAVHEQNLSNVRVRLNFIRCQSCIGLPKFKTIQDIFGSIVTCLSTVTCALTCYTQLENVDALDRMIYTERYIYLRCASVALTNEFKNFCCTLMLLDNHSNNVHQVEVCKFAITIYTCIVYASKNFSNESNTHIA